MRPMASEQIASGSTVKLMFHDDSCGELLDVRGRCPRCGFCPDMQSTAFRPVPVDEVDRMLRQGKTFLGLCRKPVM